MRALFLPAGERCAGGAGRCFCRATPSCPFVLPDSVKHARLLTPLAFAFGLRAGSAVRPFRGARTRGASATRPRSLRAPRLRERYRVPFGAPRSVRSRPPRYRAPSARALWNSSTTKAGLRACGASAIGALPSKAVALARPSPSLARPSGALTAFSLWLSPSPSGGSAGRGCRTALCA